MKDFCRVVGNHRFFDSLRLTAVELVRHNKMTGNQVMAMMQDTMLSCSACNTIGSERDSNYALKALLKCSGCAVAW